MTSEAKERPNFHIVEGYSVEVDYEEFKKDFLNPLFLSEEVRKKYGLSVKQYMNYRNKVLKETGLRRKPSKSGYKLLERLPLNTDCLCSQHIIESNGDYMIRKVICRKVRYFGRYDDYNNAVIVRNKLVECDWDDEVAQELISIYGKKRLRPSLDKAKKLYDEYEHRYFHEKETRVDIIKKEMGISRTTYTYLLKMLRANHGKDVHRWMYD